MERGRMEPAERSATDSWTGIWGSDANNIWVIGSLGNIFKWDGTAWAAQSSGPTQAQGIWGVDRSNNVWIVGTDSRLGVIQNGTAPTWHSLGERHQERD